MHCNALESTSLCTSLLFSPLLSPPISSPLLFSIQNPSSHFVHIIHIELRMDKYKFRYTVSAEFYHHSIVPLP